METLPVDGDDIAYERRGDGRPLVLLHGAWMDRRLWTPQLDRLAGRFDVVAPDLRGHGDAAGDDGVALDRMAADVGALCDALDLANPVVCGLSMGGLVAQHVALDRPDLVSGLVLADTVRSVPPVPVPESARRLLFPTAPAKLLVRTWGPGAYFRSLLAGVEATGPWLALDDDARSYALGCVDDYGAAGFSRVLDAFAAHSPRDLSTLSVPALVLDGDHEAAPVRAHGRAMARTIPDATRTVVPDAGHLSNRDNPAAFDDAVERFADERAG